MTESLLRRVIEILNISLSTKSFFERFKSGFQTAQCMHMQTQIDCYPRFKLFFYIEQILWAAVSNINSICKSLKTITCLKVPGHNASKMVNIGPKNLFLFGLDNMWLWFLIVWQGIVWPEASWPDTLAKICRTHLLINHKYKNKNNLVRSCCLQMVRFICFLLNIAFVICKSYLYEFD